MQEDSLMIVIPGNPKDIKDPKKLEANLRSKSNIEINKISLDEFKRIVMDLSIDKREYTIFLSMEPVQIPPFIRVNHLFTPKENKLIGKAEIGLGVSMSFSGDSRVCFYDQLRIVNAMVPGLLAVMDVAAEKLISGRWIALAAASKVMPAPRYLFTVQAVSGDDDEVWLHTHGLKRCGLYELEIMFSDKDRYNTHYQVIETMAYRMLEAEEPVKPGDAVFNAQLSDGNYIVTTAVDWKEAMPFYPDAKLGKDADRDEYHSDDYFVVMTYMTPKDEDEKKYSKIQDFDDVIEDNPIFMISTEETERMSALARERIDYFIRAKKKIRKCACLVKIGLKTDSEDESGMSREHIWFELKEAKDGKLVAELTQDPYYVSGIKSGDIGTYSTDEVTDWLILTPERRISPDDAYLLDM
ncbi:MAG: DUF4026 domain-containing protein [Lachnospiraceae bacterium]|nr:DUF4026 domain-containing protein [Lachnospiraceae bacterium]